MRLHPPPVRRAVTVAQDGAEVASPPTATGHPPPPTRPRPETPPRVHGRRPTTNRPPPEPALVPGGASVYRARGRGLTPRGSRVNRLSTRHPATPTTARPSPAGGRTDR